MENVILLASLMSLFILCNACPKSCLCNSTIKSVTCMGGYSSSLTRFVSDVPADTQYIYVKGARFQYLTYELQQLPDVRVLSLRNCRITSISTIAFHGLKSLTQLHLDGNKIDTLQVGVFSRLSSLQFLNLSGNAIETLHENLFADLKQLRVLDLKNNHLKVLSADQFINQEHLQAVDLGDNAVDYIHPSTFNSLKDVTIIKINSNFIQSLHESTFQNNTELKQVDLYDNPWDCNCGLRWLLSDIRDPLLTKMYPCQDRIKCSSPYPLHSVQLKTLNTDSLQCIDPEIHTPPYEVSVINQHGTILNCNATGYPRPSIVWVTPRGKLLSHPKFKRWISSNISNFATRQTYAGMPTYFESEVAVLANGSLQVSQLRYFFAGKYVCMAMNPSGMVVNIVNVKIVSSMREHFIMSLFVSGASALAMLVLGIIIGSIRLLCETFCCKKEKAVELDIVSACPYHYPEIPDISPPKSPWHKRSLVDIAEISGENSDYEDYYDSEGMHIKETLDDVKKRLRTGVDKSMERMRCRAQHIRESTNHTMQTIREKSQTIKVNASQSMQTIRQSASNSMNTIKQSSSQYATRLRTGVVLGVEQVKYHVQSMKELCGTGDMGQTVSCVSMSTDVDSQERSEVFRTVTSV